MSEIRFTTVIGEDQVIRPPQGVHLPAGAAEIVVRAPVPNQPETPRSLIQELAKAAQELDIVGLPPDLAENHDHYAHGAPKGLDKP